MSMITNVYYVPTLLGALGNTYATGSYVRTLGFAEAGDGGAAMYEVVSVSGSPISYPDVSLYCEDGRFSKTAFTCFKLIPQNGKVYAEQFGVLPGDTAYSANNSAMLRHAVAYSASNGYRLEFGSKSTYYFSGSGVDLKNNLFIDGNGAIFEICGTGGAVTFFDTIDEDDNVYIAHNVTLRNFTCVGRSGDQFLYGNIDGFVMQNVTVKNFGYGLRTRTRTISANYDQPEIVNKNWLVEDCVINVATSFQMSEIDGITVKDSVLTSFYPTSFPVGTIAKDYGGYDGHDYPEAYIYDVLGGTHNIYMSSNCMNVRLSNLIMGNVTGDAVHKAYAINYDEKEQIPMRFDKSKNHFYTDLSIHKCNAPMTIGFISENVMCDNVYGTKLRYLVHLSAASNCIVANSALTADRELFDRGSAKNINENKGLYIQDACSCWFQNSYLFTNGRPRAATSSGSDDHYREMTIKTVDSINSNFTDKRYCRNFIGSGFDITNHWFKFTGCEIINDFEGSYYFIESIDTLNSVFHEYMENCSLTHTKVSDYIRLKCINALPCGMTFRNCHLKNTIIGCASPFRFHCAQSNCNCMTQDTCKWMLMQKRFPFIHYENNVLDNFGYAKYQVPLQYHFNTYYGDAHNLTLQKSINISGTYMSNSYRLLDGKFKSLNNLMGTS